MTALSRGARPSEAYKALEDERGTSVVEFVTVLSLLLLILFGTVELALLFQTRTVLLNAAREGARRAAIAGGDTSEVRSFIDQQLQLGEVDPERVEVTISPRNVAYGSTVFVTLRYHHDVVTPIARDLLGHTIPLEVEVLARAERLQY